MSDATTNPDFDLEPYYKEQFASFLAAGFSPFVAALKIWPAYAGFAYDISLRWPADPHVLALVEKAKVESEAADKPPTKEAFIKTVFTDAKSMADDDKIKAYRLVAEMSGFIEKAAPASVSVTTNQQVNRVMIVKDKGTDDEWENKLRTQQMKLIEDAS